MTPAEFIPPYLLLELHYNREKRPLSEEERDALRESWYRRLKVFDVLVWQRVVEKWIDTEKWMPAPAELLTRCQYEAEAVALAHEQADYAKHQYALMMAGAPLSRERLTDMAQDYKRFKEAKTGLTPPAPARPQLGDFDGER